MKKIKEYINNQEDAFEAEDVFEKYNAQKESNIINPKP